MKVIIILCMISVIASAFAFSCSDGLEPRNTRQSQNSDDENSKNDTNDDVTESKKASKDDGKPPVFPENFKAKAKDTALQVELTWQWVDDPEDLDKLKIVRSQGDRAPKDCGDGEDVFETSDRNTEDFVDIVPKSGTYSYRLCTFDPQGNQDEGDTVAEAITPKPDCGGKEVGGHCWYAYNITPPDKLLCSEACKDHGGADMDATNKFAGAQGTDKNCKLVLEALNVGTGEVKRVSGGTIYKLGCFHVVLGTGERRRGTSGPNDATVDDAGFDVANITRPCACNE